MFRAVEEAMEETESCAQSGLGFWQTVVIEEPSGSRINRSDKWQGNKTSSPKMNV